MNNKKTKAPKEIKITPQDADELLSRLRDKKITTKDAETLAAILSMFLWMQERLSRAKLSIRRLRKLFGFTSESTKKSKKTSEEKPDDTDDAGEQNPADEKELDHSSSSETKNKLSRNFDSNENHGRLGADDYTGCEEIDVALDEHFKNRKCPKCLESGTVATLRPYKSPSVVLILEGSPLITGKKYKLERVRCEVCQSYFCANPPKGINKNQRYTPSCATSIAIHHYGEGLPFKRLETLQKFQGIPLPDSTQYDLVSDLCRTVISPIAKTLRQYAANGSLIHFDDTKGRILEQIKLNNENPSNRKSIHSTAMLSEYQGRKIYLFNTNTKTAGKELKSLLSMRDVDEQMITMSDASASNFPDLDERLLAKWIICLCLTHSRRQFFELLENGADDIKFILKIITQVYHHDRYCKLKNMSDEKRLTYHEKHSEPLMESMRLWITNCLKFKTVEPSSHFGEAIIYTLKNWEPLIQFCRVAGAPLDNNLCEQAIKIFIRYRKNSLFYRTFNGAEIGDSIMSVLNTARHTGINVFDYFSNLQANARAVNLTPEQWLPWNYQETLAKLSGDFPLTAIA